MNDIYLDAAATAKLSSVDDIVIINTIANAMRTLWQNPSSLYASKVKEEIDRCRVNIANFIGAKPEEIIFTSGASESNNMAIRGWYDYTRINNSQTPVIITTPIEHKATLKLIESGLTEYSYIFYCAINSFGLVDYSCLEGLLKICGDRPILVSVYHGNNEIGSINDLKKISDLVHKYNGIVHTDATQTFGHIPINVNELGVDMISVSGHKISPVLRGIGVLYKRDGVNIQPLVYGNQEGGLRGGTENTYGIIGLSKAIEHCDIRQEYIDRICSMRDYFVHLLENKFGCKLNGDRKSRLPNNINVTFPQNITGESLLYMLDLANIQIGVGSACNSKSTEHSHVLKVIGLSDEEAMRSVRFTLPTDITYTKIDYVIEEIEKAVKIIEG